MPLVCVLAGGLKWHVGSCPLCGTYVNNIL
jgi:hypothetical protein